MSIVGPRPHMLEHTQFYSDEILNFMQRHKCLPGLTGWAQIHGFRGPTRNKELMEKRFQHDLYYIKNWNLILDFYIMVSEHFSLYFFKKLTEYSIFYAFFASSSSYKLIIF